MGPCAGGGGGGGGNRPPTCSINLPSTITYDGQKYINTSTGQLITKQPTRRSGSLSLSDPDGDTVRVTQIQVDKPNCLAVSRSGNTLYATPQGSVTGKTPSLSSTNKCSVKITVKISDGKAGGTASCSKTVQVVYPPTRIQKVYIYDKNDQSVQKDTPGSGGTTVQGGFLYVGGSNPDTGRYAMQPLQGAYPTQLLPPASARFARTATLKRDHAPFELRAVFYDENGHLGFNPAQVQVALRLWNTTYHLRDSV